ncbi:MAG: thioredoxin family protein [Akkermansia muciniphila]
MFKHYFTSLLLPLLAAPVFGLDWTTDVEAARAKAQAEGKAVLLDFTGSDWCSWCIKLRQEVFDTPQFEAYAKDKFVPVEVDLPRYHSISPELMKQNVALCKKYRVTGFPTVIVLNAKGELVGGFSGGRDNVDIVIRFLDAALKNAALLKEADAAEGEEQLRKLIEVHRNLGPGFRDIAPELEARIMALDTQDISGLHRAKAAREELDRISRAISDTPNPADVLPLLRQAAETGMPENRICILQWLEGVQLYVAQSPEDLDQAEATALRAVQLMKEQADPRAARTETSVRNRYRDKRDFFRRLKRNRS